MDKTKFNVNCEINKLDDDKRLVFAWASVIEKNGEPVVDLQGDVISSDELEQAVYNYVIDSRDAGEMHFRKGVGTLVESIVFTKEKQEALGIDLGKVGWFVGFKITDDQVWESVKKGKYAMLSIGGRGVREKIDEEE
ncbi:MAG: XkdF-like putative serine protease domain-containing protein [Clostridium sp.]|nr:XkdF-like putative serine protease domain-containing protein [Clostridium sp.]